MKNRMKLLAIACFLVISALVFAGSGNLKVVVNLRAHRGEIRKCLLRQTPLGSTSQSVLKFIATQLEFSGSGSPKIESGPATGSAAEASQDRGVKRIRIYLGQYYEHPEVVFLTAPILMEREVSAQWAFDKEDRLVDIFIDKNTGVY